MHSLLERKCFDKASMVLLVQGHENGLLYVEALPGIVLVRMIS